MFLPTNIVSSFLSAVRIIALTRGWIFPVTACRSVSGKKIPARGGDPSADAGGLTDYVALPAAVLAENRERQLVEIEPRIAGQQHRFCFHIAYEPETRFTDDYLAAFVFHHITAGVSRVIHAAFGFAAGARDAVATLGA